MTDPTDPDKEQERIRRSRNRVLALTLGFFVLLVYFVSFVKMS